MKLYYSKGACSLAIRIILNEIGVDCEYIAVNLKTKQTEHGENFFNINPKGSVPTLALTDNSILTENTVIQQYLADKYQALNLLPPLHQIQRYRVLEWLNFVSTELHKGCSPFFNPDVPPEVKEGVFTPILKSKLELVNEQLKENTYLTGSTFTLVDSYLFVVLSWLPAFHIPLSDYLHLTRYFTQMKQRPAIIKALHEEGLVY